MSMVEISYRTVNMHISTSIGTLPEISERVAKCAVQRAKKRNIHSATANRIHKGGLMSCVDLHLRPLAVLALETGYRPW